MSVRSIENGLTRMEEVTSPRALAAHRLETATYQFSAAVRDRLIGFTGDGEPPIQSFIDDVTENIAAYEHVAETPKHREMATKFRDLWTNFSSLGLQLANGTGDRTALNRDFAAHRTKILNFLNHEMFADSHNINLDLQRAVFENTRTVERFVVVLLVAGAVIAIATSVLASGGIVRTETAINEERERYRVTLSSIGDAVIATDSYGKVRFMNPVAEALTGWKGNEAEGRQLDEVFRIVNEITRATVENPAIRSLREGVIVGLANHTVLIAKDGREIPIDDSAAPIGDGKGKPTGAVLVFRDITERKKDEEKTARLAAIITSSDDAIVSKDLNGIVNSWNRGAERLFGFTEAEMIGKPITTIIPKEYQNEEPKILERLRRGEAIDHFETVRQRKDGSLRNISLTVSPLLNSEGHIIGAAKIARDITDRKNLEKKVVEQAEALVQESRRKDEFLAMLSHELRNPLAPIRAALHLLKRQTDGKDAQIRQPIEIIDRQANHLTKLVSDLLEVSRVISGRIQLQRQVVDLNEVIAHAAESVKPVIDQHKHELVVHRCADALWVNVDVTRIEEVLINILNNASKYTDPGGRIELDCDCHSANSARIRIRDNGIGIDPQLLPRIFDLFTQADRSLARSAGGLGIGLSLAQRLVVLHEGSIVAKSPPEPGAKGSEFVVTLPLVPAPEKADATRAITAPAEPAKRSRVLVVDDNVDQVLMVATALRHEGHEVETAYTGTDGLDRALRWKPDVILLDIGLPGIDGFEVARRIRDDGTLNHTRIIAVTGYAGPSDINNAQLAGIDQHLIKPYDLSDVLKRIQEMN